MRIWVDDVTGKQLASPDDATNGGSRQLRDADAQRWLAENPSRALQEAKEAAKPANKALPKSENKAKS